MENKLKGQVAVVTGGSRGIGRAIALRLAQLGCDVTFNYLHSESEALKLEKEIQSCSVRCFAQRVDIKDFEKVKAWMDVTKEKFGRMDILINNAGIIKDKALMLMGPIDWNEVIDTNLNGVFNASRAAIVAFLKQKSGNIINISSVSGLIGMPRQTNYSAAKGGINGFTKALAKEVAAYGIRVNAIAPGFIETEMISQLTAEYREQALKMIPLGRMGNPEDVANCVKFLLSDEAQYITGQVINVDGGLVMR